jgi:DHA1 family inner membrane transport protein
MAAMPEAVALPLSRRRAQGALAALALTAFLYVTTETLIVGLLPQVAGSFHVSLSRTGILVTGYAATVAVMSVPLTLATRRVERRRLLGTCLCLFVVSTVIGAAATSYWLLLGTRIVTAFTHSIFWSVVAATAAGLFAPASRGRVLTAIFAGSTLATVLGTPAGTWLGQHTSWRVAYLTVGLLGLVVAIAVVALVPARPVHESHAARGVHPDGRRYGVLVAATMLGMGGFFTMFTYVTAYLTRISGFSLAAVSPILLAGGLAGVLGVLFSGRVVDRSPRLAVGAPMGVLVFALFGLYAVGTHGYVAVALVAVGNFGISGFATALQGRVLDVAPGSSDVASAGASAAFNVGIGGGAALGAALLPWTGTHSLALVGGLLGALALAALLAEPVLARERVR